MTLKQENDLKNFFIKELDGNITMQFLGHDSENIENDMCVLDAQKQLLDINISEDDYWSDNYFYVDFVIMEDKKYAWQVQYNPELIIFDDLFDVLKQILKNKKPKKIEGNVLPFPWHCNYAQLIKNLQN